MGAAETWADVEAAIEDAVAKGILVDKRKEMPRGVMNGKQREWYKRDSPEVVLGCCVHQSAGRSTKDPRAPARYHTSTHNHITPGRPLPSLVYLVAIPDDGGPAWLCGDLSWRTYGQGAKEADHPGDENKHIIPILVQGGFVGLGWKPKWAKAGPSEHQMGNLVKVVDWLMEVFAFGGEGVFGHYHFGKAACPGFVASAWVEEVRAKDDKAELVDTREVQEALLRWNAACLPKYGADGDFGGETRGALISFQREMGIRETGREDPFTELILLQRYTAPELAKAWHEKTGSADKAIEVSKDASAALSVDAEEKCAEYARPEPEPVTEPLRAPTKAKKRASKKRKGS